MTNNERPLITFVVMAYNQEGYIREAVEGAFSQAYSPLEIILSDDCSSDKTFDIMQKMVAEYHGPHTIILNRNETNQGIGGHVNRLVELSKGELIVGSAGDDISLPERTQRTYEAWEASNREAYSIFSNAVIIDENGIEKGLRFSDKPEIPNTINDSLRALTCRVTGCTHAFHKDLFIKFGDMSANIIMEDNVIPFRALLLNKKIVYINDVLVKYRRVKGQNISGNNILMVRSTLEVFEQWKRDAALLNIIISNNAVNAAKIELYTLQSKMINEINSGHILKGLLALIKASLLMRRPVFIRFFMKEIMVKKQRSIPIA